VRRRIGGFLAAALLATGAWGCGGQVASGGHDRGAPPLTVSAAASLKEPLTACSARLPYATVRLQFGGSDELAAQIRQGVKPDVYAAANTELPEQLAREGLLERPLAYATNRLVIAVPQGSGIAGLQDLARPGVTLAIGSEGVPVGDYTRRVLGRLPGSRRQAILRNVRTEEPDVKGVIGKVAQRAVDAGFTYVTDVTATRGQLEAVAIPAALQPTVVYAAGVVRGARQGQAAERFLRGMRHGPCAQALRQAGFGAPPKG
jgi:molybdate transport system substrate-binding protein